MARKMEMVKTTVIEIETGGDRDKKMCSRMKDRIFLRTYNSATMHCESVGDAMRTKE
jgi:hypothetical protein